MSFLRGVFLAFSMFSVFPMPKTEWNEKNMRWMLCGLPFVGLVIGAALWLWAWLANLLGFGVILLATGFTVLPIALSGGIHLDGFCDSMDALSSHAEPEKKREILKDPHSGAFALIGIVTYILPYFAFCTELTPDRKTLTLLLLMHSLSRTGSAVAAIALPVNGKQGLLNTFHHAADKKSALLFLSAIFLLLAAGLLATDPFAGILMILVIFAGQLYIYVISRKHFEGMSGDLSGYFVQITEFTMVAVIAVTAKVVLLL